jgi:hypothetical protein
LAADKRGAGHNRCFPAAREKVVEAFVSNAWALGTSASTT